MAKSKYLKFRGISSYAMLYSPDEYNDKRFWKMNFHPTKEVIAKIKEAGIQNKLKDDTGNIPNASGPFFTFKRDCEKSFSDGTTYFSPPQVLDKDGKKIVHYVLDGKDTQSYTGDTRPDRVGEPVLIGNGSEVEITLEVYPTKRFGNGSRLASVRIIDLIEYDPDREEEKEEVKAEVEEEKPVEKPAKKKVGW